MSQDHEIFSARRDAAQRRREKEREKEKREENGPSENRVDDTKRNTINGANCPILFGKGREAASRREVG